ncbi:MAG: glycosyltransferase family 1 protein [Propionibacteriaceae bacterium]|jgi:hypothetical protein|nr:glycosyltransferase family 1 protein [Propionibacteriaceae bacterium]
MKIAIQYAGLTIDDAGHVAGHDAGDTLVRRLIRIFPGAILIGTKRHKYKEFELMPLEMVDGENTVVINMNVIDSVPTWRVLKETCESPKLVNFVWWSPQRYASKIEAAELSLSCALFPTIANSDRTASALRVELQRWTAQHLGEKAKMSSANLGIQLEHAQERQDTEVPVVLYPAIYMSSRKNPKLFFEIMSRVVKQTPVKVEVRLVESHLTSNQAMEFGRQRWATVSPLLPFRHDYWAALARTTAFLATSDEESYGLQYVEAMVAGAIGVMPDKDWAHAILPEGYPFLYTTPAEAEKMVLRAVTDPDACRAELDAIVDGTFTEWLREHHDQDQFESTMVTCIEEWFGPVEGATQ